MKTLATNLAGGFLLLVLIVVGMQGSTILSGLAVGASVGLTLFIYLGPERLVPEGNARDRGLVIALHPLLIDLLCATGMPQSEAQRLLPEL